MLVMGEGKAEAELRFPSLKNSSVFKSLLTAHLHWTARWSRAGATCFLCTVVSSTRSLVLRQWLLNGNKRS